MNVARELGKLRNGMGLLAASQFVSKRNRNQAVAILNIKDHRVAAHVAPVPQNLAAALAARHQARQVNRAHFKILGDWNRLLHNRFGDPTRNRQRFPHLHRVALAVAIGVPDRIAQFRGCQVRGF